MAEKRILNPEKALHYFLFWIMAASILYDLINQERIQYLLRKNSRDICVKTSGDPESDYLWIMGGIVPAFQRINSHAPKGETPFSLYINSTKHDLFHPCLTEIQIETTQDAVKSICGGSEDMACAFYRSANGHVSIGGSIQNFRQNYGWNPIEANVCMSAESIVLHELGHIMGFGHDQNSTLMRRSGCLTIDNVEIQAIFWGSRPAN